MTKKLLLSRKAYAELIGLRPQVIERQVMQGVIPTHGPKKLIDPEEANAARARNLKRRHPGRARSPEPPPTDAVPFLELQRLHEAEKVEQARIKTATMRGELLERAAVDKRAFDRGRQVRDAVLNWPGRVAATLAAGWGLDAGRVHRDLEDALRDLLTEIAEQPPPVVDEDARAAAG